VDVVAVSRGPAGLADPAALVLSSFWDGLFIPLCRECAGLDQVDIEAHLLASRLLQACERLGHRVDIED
jgi:hypothetical protein